MSASNLHSYWSGRHRNDIAENSICRKREREEQLRQSLKENFEYHRRCDMLASTYSAFEDGRPTSSHNRRNVESLTGELEKELKEKESMQRRERLAALLFTEQAQLELEAKIKRDLERQADPWNTKAMKERLEFLKAQKEAEQLQISEKKLYQRRQMNSLEAERISSQKAKKDLTKVWEGQIQHKQKELEKERVLSARYVEERQLEHEKQGRVSEQQKRMKEAENRVYLDGLKLQMAELKDKEVEEEKLRSEESKLLKYEQELERIKREQAELQETRKKRELSEILERQHKAKLRERALEVQRQLEEDEKFLDGVFGNESRTLACESAKREKLKSDAEWMKSIISEQMKLEKERQAEIQTLYQEEAETMWKKREDEWRQEREARHKLMTEVVDGLKTQVRAKIERNRKNGEDCAKEREALLRDVEKRKEHSEQERRDTIADREQYGRDLLEQINENQQRKDEERNLSLASQQGEPLVNDAKPLPGLTLQ